MHFDLDSIKYNIKTSHLMFQPVFVFHKYTLVLHVTPATRFKKVLNMSVFQQSAFNLRFMETWLCTMSANYSK